MKYILLAHSNIDFFSIFQQIKQAIPSHAVIYLSYVLGTSEEHESRTILPRDEIKKRLKLRFETGMRLEEVTDPEHKPFYDQFKKDVLRRSICSLVSI